VVLLKEFEGKHAEELVKVCPKKVFDIEDMGQGEVKAFQVSFKCFYILAFE